MTDQIITGYQIVQVKGAEPVADQVITPTKIIIDGHYPSETKEDVERLAQAFRIDAWKIFNALRSLPGGTFDQLLILMLQKTASSFVVPHDFHDEKPKSSMLSLLEKAYPIVEEEAERRNMAMQGDSDKSYPAGEYWTEMRELADEISAEIDKAKGSQ